MPRLLPRILHKIAQEKDHPKYFPFKNPQSPVSRYKPLPPRPSFQPADYPTSILFSPAPNPVTNPREYDIRKSLPPVKCRPPRLNISPAKYHHDTPREMTDDERAWWSSPYLRMLASPMRHCFVTQRHLPADFLVRLGAVRVPGTSRPQTTLIPDGLQHTKFAARQSPSAVHVSCHRKVVLQLLNRGGIQRIAPNAQLYPNLPDYIADMLRARVLQELELHCDQLAFRPRYNPQNGPRTPSLRRLTRREWEAIKDSGIVPYHNALALIIVPPPNKNRSTGERPIPSMFSEPPASGEPLTHLNSLPLSALLHVSNEVISPDDGTLPPPDRLPSSRVPLYNGATMFPNPEQRAYLYSQLCRALAWEARKRAIIQNEARGSKLTAVNLSSDEKASHTFLLSSDQEIVKFGDITAAAVALWRVRMYEGGGWDQENTWALDPPKHAWRSERYKLGSDTVGSS